MLAFSQSLSTVYVHIIRILKTGDWFCVCCSICLEAMSGDCSAQSAKLDKEQLMQKYGDDVASKLLSINADICRLYKRSVDCVGQDPSQIAQLAEPLCQYIAEIQRQRRRRRWQRLMLCFAAVILLSSCLVACETSCRFIVAVTRILWIKVD